MAVSRDYRVARHTFRVVAPEDVFAGLSNYAPFAVDAAGDAAVEPLFVLTVADSPVVLPAVAPIMVDRSDADMPRIEVYRQPDGGWLLAVSMFRDSDIVFSMETTADFRQASLSVLTQDYRFAIDNATMLLFAFTTACASTLVMHASVVCRADEAFLFLGHSGTGKSTHSRLWMQTFSDAWLLNDDNPIVRIVDGQPLVFGSPWSGKTPCYNNAYAPIRALVMLSQTPHNQLRTMRLAEAYAVVMSSSSGLKILPEMMDGLHDTMARLVQTVGTYHMECLPNTEAAEVCCQGILASRNVNAH